MTKLNLNKLLKENIKTIFIIGLVATEITIFFYFKGLISFYGSFDYTLFDILNFNLLYQYICNFGAIVTFCIMYEIYSTNIIKENVKQLFKYTFKSKHVFITFVATFLFIFFNFYYVNIVLIIILSIIATYLLLSLAFLYRKFLDNNKFRLNDEYKSLNFPKKIAFIVCLFILFTIVSYFIGQYSALNKKQYSVIDKNKVVIYTTNNNYVIQDCRIINKTLEIDTSSYTIIDKTDIAIKNYTFDDVIINSTPSTND